MPRVDRWRYGHGVIRLTPAGTYSAFVALGRGRRRRKVLKSLAEARAWVDSATPERIDCRFAPDAAAALSILPDGVTLLDAARYWVDSHPASESVSLADAWTRFESSHAVALRRRTLSSYRAAFASFAASVGGMARPLSAATRSAVEAFVSCKTPVARNGAVRALRAVFSDLVRQGLLRDNPCAAVSLAKVAAGVPSVLSVEDGRALLASVVATRPDAVAYFALGMFAGLRPAEAMRVKPTAVVNGYVVLTPRDTKTADARNIALRPNLAAWLAKFPIPARGFSLRAVKQAKAAATVHIPQDALRHSFGTYAYEQGKDAASVAAEMGHQGTAVFFKHYRALCAPGDGAKWFSIEP